MQTLIPGDTVDTLKSMRDLGVGSLTEGMRQVLGVHKWYTDAQSIGSLLIAVSPEAVEPLAPANFTADEDRASTKVTVNVNPDVKAYLDTYVTGDPLDLIPLWGSATSFYSDVMERQVLGQRFFKIKPSLTIAETFINNPFGEPDQPPTTSLPPGLRFLGRLRRRGDKNK